MQELLRKIKADADARLTLPSGRQATSELPRFKGFLKLETHRLKMLHRAGEGGQHICRARAAVVDVLLVYLWTAAMNNLPEGARKDLAHVALVALGGYGRGELNPHSDIDFMFLHKGQIFAGRPKPDFSTLIDGILYPLWDIGLKVGHCVRDPQECVQVANSDMQSKTSLIEARLVTGDEVLFKRFERTLVTECVNPFEEEYVRMRVEDQAARHAKFGNSACMQEPNIKNGCGGLRDFQNLLWMAFFKHRTRSLRDLQRHNLIFESEAKQLQHAYDFLLRVRTEMHYHMNRGLDVLNKNLQPTVGYNLGYRERSPSKRIEGFMRDVYTHSRNIFLITRTLEKRLALVPQPRRLFSALLPRGRKPPVQTVDGFKFGDSEIMAESDRVFAEQPRRLMRVFLYAQQRGLRLHPDLAQLIRHETRLVDRRFLSDEHVRDTFLTILNRRGSVAAILRPMHEVDLLGKYIPEFGKLTCLVQHEFYHQYTADEHTLMCVEQLDRVWEAKEPPYKPYAELFHKLERPFILYLALLLHDVGKPEARGNHTSVSSQMALKAARRLALDETSTHGLQVVIEHHLLLASVSQRRDLDDPAVIRHVARQVETPELLEMITLHTFVDSLATSDKLWNGFKDSLLWLLHEKAVRLMAEGPGFTRAEELQRAQLREQVLRSLPNHISQEEVDAHFTALPARYFQIHTAREILDDLDLSHRFMSLQLSDQESGLAPVIRFEPDPDRGCSLMKICTWDRAGLFSKIAGSFGAAGLNILDAQVFSRSDGFVHDSFSVMDARTGEPANQEQRHRFEEVLRKALTGSDVDFHGLIAKQKVSRPLYQAYTGERMSTTIQFDNQTSETRTLVEIQTEDRLGLLYEVSQALTELSLDVSGAKISTEKGAAIDSFYVRELDGTKVMGATRQQAIEQRLRQAIGSLDQR
jgi:[protein-PII] uridylyltransferase